MTAYAVLEALADPTRRSIFEALRTGPQSVTELAGTTPISRPAVSQHLKVLKDARLVTVEPHGTRRVYALDPAGLTAVRAYFEQFWATSLEAYARAVFERPAVPPTDAGRPAPTTSGKEKP